MCICVYIYCFDWICAAIEKSEQEELVRLEKCGGGGGKTDWRKERRKGGGNEREWESEREREIKWT